MQDFNKLIDLARAKARKWQPSPNMEVGGVAAAILTRSGTIFTGVCLDATCGIGFCAEHSAIAKMLEEGESEIVAVVALTHRGRFLPPCGRCRELMFQTNPLNLATRILIDAETSVTLADLLPMRWQEFKTPQ